MAVVASVAVEFFYYGQAVRQGQVDRELRLLAASAGIRQDEVTDIVWAALIPPLPDAATCAWGLVRGKGGRFILAQSGVNEAGAAVLRYLLLPDDSVRAMAGNVRALARLLEPALPVFDGRRGADLAPLRLRSVPQVTAEAQIEAMLALMACTKDRLDVIERLLAAVIQGVPIFVQNAPKETEARLAFIEGLLALLPPPARFGVTFVTHSAATTRLDALIRFTNAQTLPEGVTGFDWATASVSGHVASDDYSRFIVSQLRLDPSLVLEQTQALTAVAQWRVTRGDTLAEALGYASYRLRVDHAVLNSLPVEAADVSRILTDDPTLEDGLRRSYVRHVLAFALALGDAGHADTIGILIRQRPELEQTALDLLTEALNSGKATRVYEVVTRWLANPLGPRGMPWTALVQTAANVSLRMLVEAGDAEGAGRLLDEFTSVQDDTATSFALPKLIETALPLMARDEALAKRLFTLAAAHFGPEQLQQMIMAPGGLRGLPPILQQYGEIVSGRQTTAIPAGLVARAAAEFEPPWTALVLIRLTETALMHERYDLIDNAALEGLAEAASSPYAADYDAVFRWLARNLSTDELLPMLDAQSPPLLLHILLARHAYSELAHELIRHARVLYRGDRDGDFARLVRRLFSEVPLTTEQASEALRALEAGNVPPMPLAMAHFGALKRNGWPPTMREAANSLTQLLADNRTLVEAIHPVLMIELLEFHAQRRDSMQTARVAGLLPALAIKSGEIGIKMMAHMFRTLHWEPDIQLAALDALRQMVRLADVRRARAAIDRLTELLGADVSNYLEATLSLRLMLDGEDLAAYAGKLRMTVKLLRDTANAYADKRTMPSLKALSNELERVASGMADGEGDQLAETMMALGRVVDTLGRTSGQRRGREAAARASALVEGKARPQTALDAMLGLAGYFSRGQRLTTSLQRTPGTRLLAGRDAASLLWEAQTATQVLVNLMMAFPPEYEVTATPEALRTEINSLWGELTPEERQTLVRPLAEDLQALPDLVMTIVEHGDSRAVDERSGLGRRLERNRQRPESALEFYRFVHGFFKARARE